MDYVAIDQTEKEVIDAHLFVEALAMVCLDIAPQKCTFAEAVDPPHQVHFRSAADGLFGRTSHRPKEAGTYEVG